MILLKTDYVLLSLKVDGEKRVFVSKSEKKKSLMKKRNLKDLILSAEQIDYNRNITMTCSKEFSYKITDTKFTMFSGTLKGKYIIEIFPNYVSILFM